MPLFNPPYVPDLYAPGQAVGDLISYDGTKWYRLPIGASGSHLYTSGSSLPIWTTDLSGSLQRLVTGQTYMAAGANVTITTSSSGQVIISASGSSGSPANTTPYSNQLGEVFLATVTQSVYRKALPVVTQNGWLVNDLGMMLVTTSSVDPNYLTAGTVYATGTGADVSASYIVVGLTSSLPNERALAASTSILISDSGAGGNIIFSVNNNVVATVSGTTFTGPVNAAMLSGSLQRLTTGETYLAPGTNIQIVTASNGQVQVSAVGLADVSASYVTIGNTGSLPNERALSAGTGLLITDAGAGSTVSLGINNNVVATVSGTTFTGPVSASFGLSGSLQQVAPGLSYLVAGSNVTIVSGSNGQVVVSAAAGTPAYTAVTSDLGAARTTGTFDITGLSGLTAGKIVLIVQTAGAISSKGSARDEPEMDLITATGYVVNSTTIRVYWSCRNIVVGTYEFAYLVSA